MRVVSLIMITFLGALLVSGELSNTLAIDSNGRYFALGVGSRSCSDHLKFSEKRLENFTPEQWEIADVIIEHWVAGFFTAHNFYVTDTFDVVGTVTIDQLQERIDKYCRANPNQPCCRSGHCDCSRVACESDKIRSLQGSAGKESGKIITGQPIELR